MQAYPLGTNLMLGERVNEKSTAELNVAFDAPPGFDPVPVSVTYSVYCMTTQTEVIPPTAIPPAQSLVIRLGVLANTIKSQANESEIRRVTVQAIYGPDDQCNSQFDYRLINLTRIT